MLVLRLVFIIHFSITVAINYLLFLNFCQIGILQQYLLASVPLENLSTDRWLSLKRQNYASSSTADVEDYNY